VLVDFPQILILSMYADSVLKHSLTFCVVLLDQNPFVVCHIMTTSLKKLLIAEIGLRHLYRESNSHLFLQN